MQDQTDFIDDELLPSEWGMKTQYKLYILGANSIYATLIMQKTKNFHCSIGVMVSAINNFHNIACNLSNP